MPTGKQIAQECPICGTVTEVHDRAWFYTCTGCGSGINMIGIWWKEQAGEDWLGLSQEEKRVAGERFYSREKEEVDWSDVVIEI